MNTPVILSLGEVLWDLFPDGEKFGGAPANFACHAAILGADASIVSAVGNDKHGREACSILERFGVDTSLVQIAGGVSTGTVGVALDESGKPTFTIHDNAAWDQVQWTDELESRLRKADAVYFGTLGQRSVIARRTLRRCVVSASRNGIPRVLDINLRAPFFDGELIRESIALAGILKLSDEELPEVCAACGIDPNETPETQLRLLLKTEDLELAVMTCGAEGAVLVTTDEIVKQPGIPTAVQDTVGAGDSFTAAFMLGLLRKDPYEKVLEDACTVAATVCSHSGAVPARLDQPSDTVRKPTLNSTLRQK